MKNNFRGFGSQPPDQLGGHSLLGGKLAHEDSRGHSASLLMSQGFSQRDQLGSDRPSQQHSILLSQQLSQPLASQGLSTRPLSSGSSFCPTPHQPTLSGVFRPNSAPSQHPAASQTSNLPNSNNSPWHQPPPSLSRLHNHEPPLMHDTAGLGLPLGSGRNGARSLYQQKQRLSVLGKPAAPGTGLQLSRPSSAPALQQAPNQNAFRGSGAAWAGELAPGAGLVGPSSRFTAAAGHRGLRAAAAGRLLLPMESQQDDDAYLLSQLDSQQQRQQTQQQPSMRRQGSSGMDWDDLAGTRQPHTITMMQGQGGGSSSSLLAAGHNQHIGLSTASREGTETGVMMGSSQQQPQPVLLEPLQQQEHNSTETAARLPVSSPRAAAAAAPMTTQQQEAAPTAALQTPKASDTAVTPRAAAPPAPSDPPAGHHTPQAAPAAAAAAAGGSSGAPGPAAAADATPQQQVLLSRISSLEEHCSSMKDIIDRDIPLLLQQQSDSSKQLQELATAAATHTSSNSTLQAQLQNLTSSVASFMAEFRNWKDQQAAHTNRDLSHAECQTTPGLAVGSTGPGNRAAPTAAVPAGTAGATWGPGGAPGSTGKAADSGRTSSFSKQGSGGRLPAAKPGSLMDFLFSQPPPPAAAAAAQDPPALAPAAPQEPDAHAAILSPSRARFKRDRPAYQHYPAPTQATAAAEHAAASPDNNSPFAVPAAPASAAAGTAAAAEEEARDTGNTPEEAAAAAGNTAAAAPAAQRPAAKRKAAGAGRKPRSKKAAHSPASDGTAAAGAGAAAAGGSRRPSTRSSQRRSPSDGLTQSKLCCQRTTRSIAAAAAALGVSLQDDAGAARAAAAELGQAPAAPPIDPDHEAPSAAAGRAAAEAEEPRPKRQRASSRSASTAAAGGVLSAEPQATANQQTHPIPAPAPVAPPIAPQRNARQPPPAAPLLLQQQAPQEQAVVPFSRHNRQLQQLQGSSAPSVHTMTGVTLNASAQLQPAALTFGVQANRPGSTGRPPAAVPGHSNAASDRPPPPPAAAAAARPPPPASLMVPQLPATRGAAPGQLPTASGAGQPRARPHSTTAASRGSAGGKRDRSGNLLHGRTGLNAQATAPSMAAATAAAAAGAATAGRGMAGQPVGASAGARSRRMSATSSAMLLFGDVEDDDSLDGVVEGRAVGSGATNAATRAAAAAVTSGPTGGTGAAKAADLQHVQRVEVDLPGQLAAGMLRPATSQFDFGADSEDSDTDHSMDQQPRQQQVMQQQQQRLVDEAELARQIAARMAKHRNKQRRTMSWQGGAGGASGVSGARSGSVSLR